jgi:hypothetical protein
MKKERERERKISQKYELLYEIASEMNKIAGYTLIPESNRVAEAQHMSEHEAFQAIQGHTLKGESEEVHKFLLEFPEFKREDLKKMLVRSVETHVKSLEL